MGRNAPFATAKVRNNLNMAKKLSTTPPNMHPWSWTVPAIHPGNVSVGGMPFICADIMLYNNPL